MNLGEANIVVRQRTLLEVVDLGVRFSFGAAPLAYLRLCMTTLVPCLLLCAAARWLLHWQWPAVWACAAACTSVVQGVFTIGAGQSMFSSQLSARAALAGFVRHLPRYFAVLLVTRMLIAVGAIVVIGAPVAWIGSAFVHEVVLLEQAPSVGEALARSARFSRNHRAQTAELLVCLLATMAISVCGVEALGQGILEFALQLGTPLGDLWEDGGSLFAIAGLLASAPLTATTRFLAYIDARTRRDAWDVQVRFMAIRAELEDRVE